MNHGWPSLSLSRRPGSLASLSTVSLSPQSIWPFRSGRSQLGRDRCWAQSCKLQENYVFVYWDVSTCNLSSLSSSTQGNGWTSDVCPCFQWPWDGCHWYRSILPNLPDHRSFGFHLILRSLLYICSLILWAYSRVGPSLRSIRASFRTTLLHNIWDSEKRWWEDDPGKRYVEDGSYEVYCLVGPSCRDQRFRWGVRCPSRYCWESFCYPTCLNVVWRSCICFWWVGSWSSSLGSHLWSGSSFSIGLSRTKTASETCGLFGCLWSWLD